MKILCKYVDVSRRIIVDIRISIIVSTFIFLIGILLSPLVNCSSSKNDPLIQLFSVIHLFKNNLIASLLIMLGFFCFGFMTVVYLISNGLIVGLAIKQQLLIGYSIGNILSKIIPHGIFEIPACILAGAIGLEGIALLLRFHFRNESLINLMKQCLINIINILIWIVILLGLASYIEYYITPH